MSRKKPKFRIRIPFHSNNEPAVTPFNKEAQIKVLQKNTGEVNKQVTTYQDAKKSKKKKRKKQNNFTVITLFQQY